MKFPNIRIFVVFALFLFSSIVWAQDKNEREVVIHNNVKLMAISPESGIAESERKQYLQFLPLFEQVLKENTTDQSDECSLIIRIVAGVKEIGSKKTKYPFARVSAFRRNSKQEFVADFILYNFGSAGPVSKDDTIQFLTKQILEPSQCNNTK
jgi:hypothetical protein